MPASLRKLSFAAAALLLLGGCTLVEPHAAHKSPLRAVKPSPDSVSVEIFFARCPAGDPQIAGSLWSSIDEQQFPPDVRRQLAENGFRAGLVGSQLPPELVQLLKLSDKPTPKTDQPVTNLETEPTVTLRHLQARSGQRNEVISSKTYDQLALLTRDAGQVRGRTYVKAEGRFALRAFPEGDGRAKIELIPELHHGEQQPHWTGSEGIMRLDASRPKQLFEQLRLQAVLGPGEMLIMTSLPDRPGSLGHYFFTEPTSQSLAQKLLIIRLAHAGQDELFSGEPVKTIDLSVE
jgi:hypothetical protein